MAVRWFRSKHTQTGHAFETDNRMSLCHIVTRDDVDRPARSGARRCRMCEKVIARVAHKKKYGLR